uniref:Transcription factor MYB54 n=1 Tax=Cicer arietinum TaxID=3827 RepID=A0A1S2YD29_CICAR|nr:transcription factor MYB54 [Cicer arietinum]
MGRSKSCNRGHWQPAEDQKLKQLVNQYGPQNWNFISQQLEGRSGKSCRLRWYNQLNPNIIKNPFSDEEEDLLLSLHKVKGNKWAAIARYFPGRTDNAVKNHFHILTARRNRERFSLYDADTILSYDNSSNSHNNFNLGNYGKKTGTLFGMSYSSSSNITSSSFDAFGVNANYNKAEKESKVVYSSILGSYHSFTAPGLPCIGKVVSLQHKFISNSIKTGKYSCEEQEQSEKCVNDVKQKGVSFIDFLGVGSSSSSSAHDDTIGGGP